jgi:hypothetical protein
MKMKLIGLEMKMPDNPGHEFSIDDSLGHAGHLYFGDIDRDR